MKVETPLKKIVSLLENWLDRNKFFLFTFGRGKKIEA